jgi:hypothetical protein
MQLGTLTPRPRGPETPRSQSPPRVFAVLAPASRRRVIRRSPLRSALGRQLSQRANASRVVWATATRQKSPFFAVSSLVSASECRKTTARTSCDDAKGLNVIKRSIPTALVLLGVLSLSGAAAIILAASSVGGSKTITTAPAITTTTVSPPTGTTGSTSQMTTVIVSQNSSTTAANQTTVETRPGVGSDTIDVALLSIGLLLILSGAFYGRITELDLPDGVAIKLSADDKAALVAKAKASAPRDTDKQRRLVARAALDLDKRRGSADQQSLDSAFARAKREEEAAG